MAQTKAQLVDISTTGVAAGSASTPGITFTGDLNTGIYSPGADQVAVATNGTGRLFVDASGRVLVGTSTSLSTNAGFTPNLQVAGTVTDAAMSVFQYRNATGAGGSLTLSHSRGASVGTQTILQSGDSFGILLFEGSDGTNPVQGALIKAEVDGTPGTNDMPGRIVLSTTADGASTPTERVRITSAGLVGIGTTSPSHRLHVGNTADNTKLLVSSSFEAALELQNGGGAELNVINSAGSGNLSFRVSNSEKARLDSSGRLLVGTSSYSFAATAVLQGNSSSSTGDAVLRMNRGGTPGANADIGLITFSDNAGNVGAEIRATNDTASSWGSGDYPGRLTFSTCGDGASSPTERMRITNDGAIYFHATSLPGAGTSTTGVGIGAGDALTVHRAAATACFFGRSNDGEVVALYSGTTQRGTISIAGATTTYGSISDHRLKENVAPIGNATSRLAQLKPSRFNFVEFPEQVVDGFIAHEVQAVVPEAVIGTKDATDENGNPLYQSVDQSKLVPLLTAALQEAIGEIESLKAEVAALKAQ